MSICITAGPLLFTNEEVEPLVVNPKVAWKLLACSNTRGYELLSAGELESFLDGRSRKITVDSIRRYIARRLAPIDPPETRPQPRRRSRSPKVGVAATRRGPP
jgi:hypothetical protein